MFCVSIRFFKTNSCGKTEVMSTLLLTIIAVLAVVFFVISGVVIPCSFLPSPFHYLQKKKNENITKNKILCIEIYEFFII